MARDKVHVVPAPIVEIRMKHYEEKRRKKLEMIKEEREVVIKEIEKTNNTLSPGHSMMASNIMKSNRTLTPSN